MERLADKESLAWNRARTYAKVALSQCPIHCWHQGQWDKTTDTVLAATCSSLEGCLRSLNSGDVRILNLGTERNYRMNLCETKLVAVENFTWI